MLWTKRELLTALEEEILNYQLDDNLIIDEVVINGRNKVKNGLFLALKGENHDAHNFLDQAIENGCESFIIEQESAIQNCKEHNFILVKDSFKALYKLAQFSRQRSPAKIIAITGSVGKTSVKEMLKTAFAAYGKTYATLGNLNNHIGLPLSLANFSQDCKFGIFEMGMNHAGEISPLSKLAHPDLAIITNVGPVHIEFFKNEQEIALAKSEIFHGITKNGKILLNHDNIHYNFLKNQTKNPHFSFGNNKNSDYCLKSSQITQIDQSKLEVSSKNGKNFHYQIASSNKTAAFNSAIVLAALDLITTDPQIGLDALKSFKANLGRGEILKAKIANKNVTIIDDSYNASLPSIAAGLEYAANLKLALKQKRVIAALGDMLELGEKSLELHKEVSNYLQQFNIDFAILVGDQMPLIANNLPQNSYITFPNSSLAATELENIIEDGDILYIKGSRGMKMEKLIENLIEN